MRGHGKKGDFSLYALHIFLKGEAEEGGRDRSSIVDMEFHLKRQTQENESNRKKLFRKKTRWFEYFQ